MPTSRSRQTGNEKSSLSSMFFMTSILSIIGTKTTFTFVDYLSYEGNNLITSELMNI